MPAPPRNSRSSGPKRNRSIASSSRPVPATTPYLRPCGKCLANTSKTALRSAAPLRSDACSMNVVCTASGDFVEIQGTAEREPFSRDLLGQLLDLAVAGCGELTRLQDAALALSPGLPWLPPSRM